MPKDPDPQKQPSDRVLDRAAEIIRERMKKLDPLIQKNVSKRIGRLK